MSISSEFKSPLKIEFEAIFQHDLWRLYIIDVQWVAHKDGNSYPKSAYATLTTIDAVKLLELLIEELPFENVSRVIKANLIDGRNIWQEPAK